MRKIIILGVLGLFLAGCSSVERRVETTEFVSKAASYDVYILRDTWGVPHVFGVTDADAAFGLAYAHAEDDFATMQDSLLAARGELATVYGRKAAASDYLTHLLRVRDVVDAQYHQKLGSDIRAVCEGYADGVNYYAALHPDEVTPGILPITGKDVVAGFVHKLPLFFGFDRTLGELFEPERKRQVSTRSAVRVFPMSEAGWQIAGSNTFAVGPDRSADGQVFLAINSHQPWDGPVAWYEAHVHSEEGWDTVGGVFPGSPVVLLGHNRNIGWASTVNWPDLVDIYVLTINPANPNQYLFDGEWRDFEVWNAPIKVKLFGPVSWTFNREVSWSIHGPVIRRPHGVYAIRYAGMGEVRQVEEWYRMNKARNFEEWQDAARMMAIAMFNFGYGDRDGNIYYLYNGLLPLRAEGYDWREYLPGDTSETLWTTYLPFDRLPQVKNPASGFIQNCNSAPYRTTIGPENPRPEDYSPTLGIETIMTNRALRALELFGSDESITEEEFYEYKYDMAYSRDSDVFGYVQEILNAPPSDDPVVREAVEVLARWDFRTNPENTEAAIGALAIAPIPRAQYRGLEPPDLMETFVDVAHKLKKAHGQIDVPWSTVNRLRRGEVDVGLGGGPNVLHAIYGGELKDGAVAAEAGDSYVLMVTWDESGVLSRSIHQYGSATLDETSPHYADQAPLFAQRKTKPVWLDVSEIRANLEREYRPGEELSR